MKTREFIDSIDEEKVADAIEKLIIRNQAINKNNNDFALILAEQELMKRKNKSITNSYHGHITETASSKMPKETKSRIGQWKWVHFKNGYCVFDPRIVIGGAKVIPQKIIVPSSTEMMDECIEKYSNTLMPFTWCVNRHNEAVVDNEGIFSVVVSRFIYQECKKYKKHIFRKHVLKWGEVTKRHMIYTFQFKFNFIELPPITIQGDAYSPAVHDLEKYHD